MGLSPDQRIAEWSKDISIRVLIGHRNQAINSRSMQDSTRTCNRITIYQTKHYPSLVSLCLHYLLDSHKYSANQIT